MKRRALALALALAGSANAEIDVRALAAAARPSGAPTPPNRVFTGAPLGALIELPEGDDPAAFGLPRLGGRFSATKLPLADLDALATAHPSWRVTWSPPFRKLLDKAGEWIRAPEFRNDTGLTGEGAIVGVIDASFDVRHPDLRNADGTTRIAWFIDFSRTPTGKHPEECLCSKRPGCPADGPDGKFPCAIFSAAEIDALIASGDDHSIPDDPEGHGTHVASLAAGNGGAEGKYVGMAPGASLICAAVADSSGNIDSAVIPVATTLVFDLAEEAGKLVGLDRVPAVVNLSLGSDFGNHDGKSSVERSLASFVGPDHPGRAIVAAAGNSATQFIGKTAYPTPLGIHTEINVPDGSSERVPIVTAVDPSKAATIDGQVFVWIAFRPDDDVSVGVDGGNGAVLVPLPRGQSNKNQTNDLTVTVVNGALAYYELAPEDQNAAAVIIDGKWPSNETFAVRLEGRGTASLWVQTGGPLGDQGALFPAATKESTIAIPASSPGVIAVGATINRTEWVDRAGKTVTIPEFGSVTNPEPDSIAYFSAAGPTSDLRMKPDIVAPGAFVVGAMSAQADPARNGQSDFASVAPCETGDENCAVVDDTHAVLVGTSMASPIAAGAVALLFAEKPDRTEDDILALLQAGARFPEGLVRLDSQLGAGALDLERVLDVEHAVTAPVSREPARDKSWMTLAGSYAHPDPTWRVPGVLELRDANGDVADGFDATALSVDVGSGTVVQKPARVLPGFYRFAVAPDEGTGGDVLRVAVSYRGSTLLERTIPIAVDVNVAREGFSARGGCSASPAKANGAPFVSWALALTAWLSRRRRSAARMARNRDRTDKSGRARPC